MLVNVAQLLQSSVGTIRRYDVDEIVDVDGTEARVKGEVTLTRTNQSILVKGVFNAEIELDCSRCLIKYNQPLEVKFEEEYFPTIDIVSGFAVKLPDEPGVFTIDKHHIIDLTEAIRQYALAAIPMKPLCKEKCPGLCPDCGKNLNEGPCTCPKEEMDPRWVKLKELMTEKQGKE